MSIVTRRNILENQNIENKIRIRLNGKDIHLGLFTDESEARQAYLDAKKIYHII